MKKPTLGHIDCPVCGGVETMRVSHDKNEEPFCHCEDCDAQLRVGGKAFRVKKFIERYQFAAAKAPEIPVTVTEPEKPAPQPAAPVTVTPKEQPVTPPAKPRSAFADAVSILGGAR